MSEALRLAEKALFTTSPNPRVGCVIVQDNEIVGRGFHEKAGESHAEVIALKEAGSQSEGSDVYVTLEPCSHTGKTPPCVDALIKAKVKKVFIAMQDPNPIVSGQGIQKLKDAHIEVELGVMEAQAQLLNMGFISRMTKQLPYVRAKLAVSLDGKTALITVRVSGLRAMQREQMFNTGELLPVQLLQGLALWCMTIQNSPCGFMSMRVNLCAWL